MTISLYLLESTRPEDLLFPPFAKNAKDGAPEVRDMDGTADAVPLLDKLQVLRSLRSLRMTIVL
jgi:hypothetical protein